MHLLGCLFLLILFGLFFIIALAGSFVNIILRLLFGGQQHSRYHSPNVDERQQHSQASPKSEEAPYTFTPEDGEYIDYEDVK